MSDKIQQLKQTLADLENERFQVLRELELLEQCQLAEREKATE